MVKVNDGTKVGPHLEGTLDPCYETTLMLPAPTMSMDLTISRLFLLIQRNNAGYGGERRGEGRYFRENEFTPRHIHKSSPPFSFPRLMRAAPWIYGIPNAVRPNLLVSWRGGRKGSRGAGASLYKLLPGELGKPWRGYGEGRDHLVALPIRRFGNWACL